MAFRLDFDTLTLLRPQNIHARVMEIILTRIIFTKLISKSSLAPGCKRDASQQMYSGNRIHVYKWPSSSIRSELNSIFNAKNEEKTNR